MSDNSQNQMSDCDQIEITEQSSQELCFSNLVPDENNKQQNSSYYNKMQRLIQYAKVDKKAIANKPKQNNETIKKKQNKKEVVQRERSRSRQKKQNRRVNQQKSAKKQILVISDSEEDIQLENKPSQQINYFQGSSRNKQNTNIQNLIEKIDRQLEAGQVKIPSKFEQLQKELDLQQWERMKFAQGDYQTRKTQKDQERREKRKVERLLEKRYKEATIGKGKDKVSNSVFNGIEDYFM